MDRLLTGLDTEHSQTVHLSHLVFAWVPEWHEQLAKAHMDLRKPTVDLRWSLTV